MNVQSIVIFLAFTLSVEALEPLDFQSPNPLPMADDCIQRDRLPEVLRIMVPPSEGRSGIQIGGSQEGDCRKVPHCMELSQPEFRKIFGRDFEGFMEFVKVPIAACKTSEDFAAESRKANANTRRLSEYLKDSRIKATMEKLIGEWCGRIEKPQPEGKNVVEIRVRFIEDNGMVVGQSIQTWNSTPDGPLGEHGYVSRFELIPWRHWHPDGVQLRGVHFSHAGDYWYAFPSEKGVQLDGGLWRFALSRDCSGYWRQE